MGVVRVEQRRDSLARGLSPLGVLALDGRRARPQPDPLLFGKQLRSRAARRSGSWLATGCLGCVKTACLRACQPRHASGQEPRQCTVSVQPRVGRRDDRTDRLLVEALVTLAALEVFQVAADRPLAQELLVLLCGRSSLGPGLGPRDACETGQRSPAVNACRRNGKSENGGIVSMPASALRPSRSASKSNCASR